MYCTADCTDQSQPARVPNGISHLRVHVSGRVVVARLCVMFFFQAEDGIRDLTVTGVQTCALPILDGRLIPVSGRDVAAGFLHKLPLFEGLGGKLKVAMTRTAGSNAHAVRASRSAEDRKSVV